jgi:hypothetical protein
MAMRRGEGRRRLLRTTSLLAGLLVGAATGAALPDHVLEQLNGLWLGVLAVVVVRLCSLADDHARVNPASDSSAAVAAAAMPASPA